MIVLLSPAKSLNEDAPILSGATQPIFEKQASEIIYQLQGYTSKRIQALMGVSEKIADLNVIRYQNYKKKHSLKNSKCALFYYNGDVYREMDRDSYTTKMLDYAQSTVRILSGLYGVLRPLDLIQPHRLEMGTKLSYGTYKNMYDIWSDKVTSNLNQSLAQHKLQYVINLASNEYFHVVQKEKLTAPVIDVAFKNYRNGAYKSFGVLSKRARGMMADFIIKNKISNIEELKKFKKAGYTFRPSDSTDSLFSFYSK